MRKSTWLKKTFILALVIIVIGGIKTSYVMTSKAASLTTPTPINQLFPDPNLAEVVREALGRWNVTDAVSQSELDSIDTLRASHKSIKRIDGIQYLTNLKLLYFFDNQISDISKLAELTDLRYLSLKDNQVKDVSALSKLNRLNELILDNNQVIDISPLAGLKNLIVLDIRNQTYTNPAINYQENIAIPITVRNETSTLLQYLKVSNNGKVANPNLMWNLSAYVPEVSYSFSEYLTVGGARTFFTGKVVQPLKPVSAKAYYDIDGVETEEKMQAGMLLTEPKTPTKEGYTFKGWYSAEAFGKKWNFTTDYTPSYDFTLYAQFKVNSYTATLEVGGKTTTQKVEYQKYLQEPGMPSKKGYSFEGWYDAKKGGKKWDFVMNKMPAKDITLYAQFKKKTESESNKQVNGATTPSSTNTNGSHTTPPAKRDGNSKSTMSKISRNNRSNKQFLDLQETTDSNKGIYDSQGTTLPKSGDSKNVPLLGLLLLGTAFVISKKT
ncbi:internalin [Listeria ivanovii]|uniref:InlB B-repeat-containing protein n=1 Tax=Listeria ivanovii TaxID=1638 RepID=UPI00065E499F|nr:InlB B-repeat-containing protein [Listeria ivanovii]PZG36973.1 internalin [Listeria ivanovii]